MAKRNPPFMLFGIFAGLIVILLGFRSDRHESAFQFQTYWAKYNEAQYLLTVDKNYAEALKCIQWLEINGNASFPDMNMLYDASVCCNMLKDSIAASDYLEKSVLKGMDLLNEPQRIKNDVGAYAYQVVFNDYMELRKKYYASKCEKMEFLLHDRKYTTLDQFVRSDIMRAVLDKEQLGTIMNYVDSANMAEFVSSVRQGLCPPTSFLIYHLYGDNETYFPLLDSCMKVELFAGRMQPDAYAFWYDRQFSFVQHAPQKFGTYIYYTEYKIDAKPKISEIESIDSVDYYRGQIGLPPLWQSAAIRGFDLPDGYKSNNREK